MLPPRIANKIEVTDHCWLWKATRMQRLSCGYGVVRFEGKDRKAHRVIWELANGPIPEGMCVLHKCDNALCVNPDHLFLGTHADNMRDMTNKGRHSEHFKGVKNPKSKLSESDVLRIRTLENSVENIAVDYQINKSTVYRIKNRQCWKDVAQTIN